MSEPAKNPFDPFFDEIRRIVREEIGALSANKDVQGIRLTRPRRMDYKAVIAYDKPGIKGDTQAVGLDAETTSGGGGNHSERPGDGRARRDRDRRTPGPVDPADSLGGGR